MRKDGRNLCTIREEKKDYGRVLPFRELGNKIVRDKLQRILPLTYHVEVIGYCPLNIEGGKGIL